jgi:hypothetical protein
VLRLELPPRARETRQEKRSVELLRTDHDDDLRGCASGHDGAAAGRARGMSPESRECAEKAQFNPLQHASPKCRRVKQQAEAVQGMHTRAPSVAAAAVFSGSEQRLERASKQRSVAPCRLCLKHCSNGKGHGRGSTDRRRFAREST